ncbi:condensation domain-containing protein, partial [Pseudoalteromonas sp. MMG012]|uniref:condensation domain-containing protein n=2 Tax=unclassified Pseudoalteromonas TaxID=194690 RepID=UPI001B3A6A64
QQRLWFIDSLQGGSAEYNMPMAFEVQGALDIAVVNRAFSDIIARHEVLRTRYTEVAGVAKQQICAMSAVHFEVAVEDLSHLTGEMQAHAVKALVDSEFTQAFNLAEDVMLRVSYIKTAGSAGVLLFNMHHIASDGWSMDVLAKEFFALYDAYSQGKASPLPELEIQYADYAHWQHTHLEGEILDNQLDYWTKQLDELPGVHSLPLCYPRPEIKAYDGALLSGSLPSAVGEKLQAVAKQYQLTPFMLLHGALSLLLARHSNSADIVIGTPVANRMQAELTPLIGFFVNTLVLRANTGHHTVGEYFKHIRTVHLEAQSHQDVPFEQLVDRLKVPRSKAHSPLFQIMMTTNTDYGLHHEGESVALPGVQMSAYESDAVQAKFDLDVELTLGDAGVGINWTYDTGLFSEAAIARLNAHLCRLLTSLSEVTEETVALPSLAMLSESETAHLVTGLNNTEIAYDKAACIHTLFEQQAQQQPDKVAVVFADKTLTYKQLNEQSNQLAHYLREHHAIGPDSLVGLCVERSLEMVVGILGILKAGGAYVPLDPHYPQERLSYMLA